MYLALVVVVVQTEDLLQWQGLLKDLQKQTAFFFRPSNITLKDQNVEPFEMAFLMPTKIKMLYRVLTANAAIMELQREWLANCLKKVNQFKMKVQKEQSFVGGSDIPTVAWIWIFQTQ